MDYVVKVTSTSYNDVCGVDVTNDITRLRKAGVGVLMSNKTPFCYTRAILKALLP